jgi:hypothetical protein
MSESLLFILQTYLPVRQTNQCVQDLFMFGRESRYFCSIYETLYIMWVAMIPKEANVILKTFMSYNKNSISISIQSVSNFAATMQMTVYVNDMHYKRILGSTL